MTFHIDVGGFYSPKFYLSRIFENRFPIRGNTIIPNYMDDIGWNKERKKFEPLFSQQTSNSHQLYLAITFVLISKLDKFNAFTAVILGERFAFPTLLLSPQKSFQNESNSISSRNLQKSPSSMLEIRTIRSKKKIRAIICDFFMCSIFFQVLTDQK